MAYGDRKGNCIYTHKQIHSSIHMNTYILLLSLSVFCLYKTMILFVSTLATLTPCLAQGALFFNSAVQCSWALEFGSPRVQAVTCLSINQSTNRSIYPSTDPPIQPASHPSSHPICMFLALPCRVEPIVCITLAQLGDREPTLTGDFLVVCNNRP